MSNEVIEGEEQYKESPLRDPYITGYHFTFFEDVCEDLKEIKSNIVDFLPTNILSVDFDFEKRAVSIKCLEFSGLPVYKLFSKINELIKVPVPIFSMLYYTTQPNGRMVEYSCKLYNMTLRTTQEQLMKSFSHDISEYTKLEHDILFSFEYYSVDDEVRNKCIELSEARFPSMRELFESRNQINDKKYEGL